jgi:hypothetical protein
MLWLVEDRCCYGTDHPESCCFERLGGYFENRSSDRDFWLTWGGFFDAWGTFSDPEHDAPHQELPSAVRT